MLIEGAIETEDKVRSALNDLVPKIREAENNVGRIEQTRRDLQLKRQQITRLKSENGEQVIAMQQKLEQDRRTRANILQNLGNLKLQNTTSNITSITQAIKSSVVTAPGAQNDP